MRVIACGTGMPTTRAAQAAACFLVELGDGEKFLFDIGSGSSKRISSLQIPYNYLDKIFIGHLHTEHFGDLIDLFVGGALDSTLRDHSRRFARLIESFLSGPGTPDTPYI